METAKVDIRRLQLLNDRINQCLDALTQVRLSVHGLAHTTSPFAAQPGAVPPIGAVAPNAAQTAWASPYAASPYAASPFAAGLGPAPVFGAYTGLSHSSPETVDSMARAALQDPFLATRIAQTFPYAFVPVAPVATIY